MALTGEVRTKITVEGTREVQRKLRSTEQSFGSFSRSTGSALQGMMALGGATLVLREVTQAASRLVREVHQLGRIGGELSPIANAFERLASPDLLQRLQTESGWLVNERTLLQESVQVLRARMLTEDEWADSIGAITRLSQDAGEDVGQMIQQFANIAAGGGVETLARLGINVAELRERLREANVSGESLEGRMMLLRGAMEQMTAAVGDADNSATNYADATDRLSNRFDAYRNAVALAFAEDERLIASLGEIERQLVEAVPGAENLGEAIAEIAVQSINAAAEIADLVGPIMEVVGAMQQLNDAINLLTQAGNFPAHIVNLLRWLGVNVGGGEISGGLADAQMLAGAAEEMGQSVMQGPDPWDIGGPGRSETGGTTVSAAGVRAIMRGGGGGGGRGNLPPTLDELMAGAMGAGDVFEELFEDADARARDFVDAEREREAALHEARMQAGQERKQFELDLREEQRRTFEEQMDSLDAVDQQLEEFIAAQREREQQIHEQRMQAVNAAAQGASAIGSIFGMIADAQEKESAAADAWRKAQGVAMGIMYGIRAGAEVAEAVASFASQNYPAGALHIVSAGLFTAQSIAAFTELAQSGGGGSSKGMSGASAAQAQFRPEPEVTRPTDAGGRTINFYSFGRDYGGFGRVVAESQWVRDRTGQTASMPAGVRVGA